MVIQKMLLIMIAVLVYSLAFSGNVLAARQSAFFTEYSSSDDARNEKKMNGGKNLMINAQFYVCGRTEPCNFVLQNAASEQFETMKDEFDLPLDKSTYRIWKKMKLDEENGEKKAFKSCQTALLSGITNNGILDISWGNGSTFKAYCDMKTDGGGWTVFQRRTDGKVSFNRNWSDYATGFGDLSDSFWLGLEAVHHLTKSGNVTLRFDLRNFVGRQGYAKYTEFKIMNESSNYEIHLSGYAGNIGDGMSMSNGNGFSTFDVDNDRFTDSDCVSLFDGAWWYNKCGYVRLNSPFPRGAVSNKAMKWTTWLPGGGTITFSEIKLRDELK